jgi:hypothetical protein
MRFSLEELIVEVPKLLNSGKINDSIEGYPILHHVMMSLRDDPQQNRYPYYLSLIETILKHPDCNPNVIDKHGKTALAYAGIQGAPSIFKGANAANRVLLNLLLQYGANPDFQCARNWTALEWTLHESPTSDVIPKLNQLTTRTERLLANCQTMFDDELEDGAEPDPDRMNILLDLGLAVYNKQFRGVPRLDPVKQFPAGHWIRVIRRPVEELAILQKRAKLSANTLSQMQHTENSVNSDPNYIPESACTFVRGGIPISLFMEGGHSGYAGFMIRPSAAPIPHWYDGHREVVSDNVIQWKGERFDNGESAGQHWNVTAKQVETILTQQFADRVSRRCKIAAEDPEHYDRHGILRDRELCEIAFSWNEGRLHYKREDIFGVYVVPDNKQSCIAALNLRRQFGLNVPLYSYDSNTGNRTRVNSIDLIRKWGLREPAPAHTQATTQQPPLLLSSASNPHPKTRRLTREEFDHKVAEGQRRARRRG